MRRTIFCCIITLCLFSGGFGCTTTPSLPSSKTDFSGLFPPLRSDRGRIFFFRQDIWAGSLITPPVWINGVYAGTSTPGEYFYVDIKEGSYRIEISEGRTLNMTLRRGEEKFIKMELGGTGIFYEIIPKGADPDSARRQIRLMHQFKKHRKGK